MRTQAISKLLSLPRIAKNIITAAVDILLLSLSLILSMLFIASFSINFQLTVLILTVSILGVLVFISFGLYRAILRFINIDAIFVIFKATLVYCLLSALPLAFLLEANTHDLLLTFFLNWLVTLFLITGSRLFAVKFLTYENYSSNVLIYGAGAAGSQLSAALTISPEFNPIAFIDEDPNLQGNYVNGLKVYDKQKISFLISSKKIQEVLIAIPSASLSTIDSILSNVEGLPVKVRTLPGIAELAQGKVSLSKLKDIKIEDILGREAIKPSAKLLEKNIKSKNVFISGAGGSIGSELARQIIQIKPSKLILLDSNEFSLYEISRELRSNEETEIISILGNVTNEMKMSQILTTFEINTVFHAAAYKHVSIVQSNPFEAVKNNIFGTLSLVKASIDSKIESFVLISTDKAVRPTNVMGATKRISELILQSLSKDITNQFRTKLTMVRFGNVLGSSGSAIPLFREQIKLGGPITVTDPNVIRYFMTIEEASQLVIQASGLSAGGDVFLLDMGEPIKILDIAKKMINLSGMTIKDRDNPEGDIEIVFTGLKSGEKLYEELLIGEQVTKTEHDKIFKSLEESYTWDEMKLILERLQQAYEEYDLSELNNIFLESVVGYIPENSNSDVLLKKK